MTIHMLFPAQKVLKATGRAWDSILMKNHSCLFLIFHALILVLFYFKFFSADLNKNIKYMYLLSDPLSQFLNCKD